MCASNDSQREITDDEAVLSEKNSTRWSKTLVKQWKENLEDLESSKSNETWDKIVKAVNNTVGPTKTKKQCKDKVHNCPD